MSKMPAFAILALYLALIYIGVKRVRLSKSQIYLLSGSWFYCPLLTVLGYLNIKNINGNVIYYGAKNIDQGRQLSFIFAHPLKEMKTFFWKHYKFSIFWIPVRLFRSFKKWCMFQLQFHSFPYFVCLLVLEFKKRIVLWLKNHIAWFIIFSLNWYF